MSTEVLVVAFVVVALLLVTAIPAYLTAHRLDRLHIRTDLARAALVGLLGRRHSVASAVASEVSAVDPATAGTLRRAVDEAKAHPPHAVIGSDPAPEPDRDSWTDDDEPAAELAENRLAAALASVDAGMLSPGLRAEVVDVADRLSMSRRFYNDAVRDTRALRERSGVRLLRLAGHAPMPDYVELVDDPRSEG